MRIARFGAMPARHLPNGRVANLATQALTNGPRRRSRSGVFA
jgi:hypothetical protein